MYVKFASAVIKDFKAFKGRHSFALDGVGVVYVIGENKRTKRLYGNGAAKSTLWDAICWCLYGYTPFGHRATDVAPWSGGKPSVTVLLVVDEVDYLCQRSTSPKNLFTINGEERADIFEVLPISLKLFINTIVLPQGKALFFDLQPKEKMQLITEACDLERWDTRSKAASDEANRIDIEVDEFVTEQQAAKGRLAELERTVSDVTESSKSWNDAAQARRQMSKQALTELEERYEARSNELGSAVLTEDGALLELRASEDELRKKEREVNRVVGEVKTLKTEHRLIVSQLERLEDEAANLSSAKRCPTCDQVVKASNLVQHQQELEARIAELEKASSDKATRRKKVVKEGEALQKQLERIDGDITRFREKANEAGDVITRLRPEVEALKREIDDAKKVKEEINPHLETLKALAERRKKLLGNLKDIEEDVADAQARAERARYWVKGFKDIKLQLIEEVLGELELTINSMIEEVGLDDWIVRCDIEKETQKGTVQRGINIQISSPESMGKSVKWDLYSGGERQRLKLIGSMALSDVLLARIGIETNLEVLDEPSVYWSSEGVAELCEFLAYRAKEWEKTIFYIEHNAVESSHFTDVMRIVKDDKGAYIE